MLYNFNLQKQDLASIIVNKFALKTFHNPNRNSSFIGEQIFFLQKKLFAGLLSSVNVKCECQVWMSNKHFDIEFIFLSRSKPNFNVTRRFFVNACMISSGDPKLQNQFFLLQQKLLPRLLRWFSWVFKIWKWKNTVFRINESVYRNTALIFWTVFCYLSLD